MAVRKFLPKRKLILLAIYTAVVVAILFSAHVAVCSLNISFSLGRAEGSGKPFSSSSPPSSRSRPSLPANMSQPENVPLASTTTTAPKPQAECPPTILTRAIWDAPVGPKMPDLKSFRLSKEMVEQRAKENIIIVTSGNYAFMDFMLNWVKHLTDLNVFNLLVGAMDTELLEALYWKGIPVFDMGSKIATIDVGWGTPSYLKMGRERVTFINTILSFGIELLLCDTDMVWLKNPLPYIARFPDADLLTSTDQVEPTKADDSLEVWQKVHTDYNVGIFHWRPTDPAKRLAKEWKDMVLRNHTLWDQAGFNELVYQVLGPSVDGESGLVYAFDGTLKLGLLPASIFCNGHTYFVQAMHQQLRLEPYAAHTTFQFAGTEGKRHRLREAMLFYDQPAYYDSPGGFLSFNPGIPKRLLLDGPHTLHSHFSLVNYQLKQIRTALAVASLLNRTLVMPPLWCKFDKMWYGHPGILEGTLTRQPFLCPMDHLFKVDVMLSDLSEAKFGPQIYFREYSFLQNPSVPKHVRESVLDVRLCEAHSKRCNISNGPTSHGLIQFPKNSSEQTYVQVFSRYEDFKVLHFSSMADAFQGFSDEAREAKFRNRVKRYVGFWCCLQSRSPGRIYYDMFWDEKPGWKPKPPRTRKDDHPPWLTTN